jgi:DNA topoisomerase I
VDEHGEPIEDPEVMARIDGLAIPPAWTTVWICRHPNGHLQATGVDAAGRRQYLYHVDWRARRDQQKFERVERFAQTLPGMRERVSFDLARRGLPRERVLAGAVRLLDRGLFRVGSEDHARNGSFGLATLMRRHVVVRGNLAQFRFVGKSGVPHVRVVSDPELLPLLRSLKRRQGPGELLTYRERDRWRDVRSTDINAYLKELVGQDHSAKDFRTWHATVLAAAVLAGREEEGGSRTRIVTATVREVAEQLGNTPAVCRASYIDPRVIDRFREGIVIDLPDELRIAGTADATADGELQDALESAVLDLLQDGVQTRSAA